MEGFAGLLGLCWVVFFSSSPPCLILLSIQITFLSERFRQENVSGRGHGGLIIAGSLWSWDENADGACCRGKVQRQARLWLQDGCVVTAAAFIYSPALESKRRFNSAKVGGPALYGEMPGAPQGEGPRPSSLRCRPRSAPGAALPLGKSAFAPSLRVPKWGWGYGGDRLERALKCLRANRWTLGQLISIGCSCQVQVPCAYHCRRPEPQRKHWGWAEIRHFFPLHQNPLPYSSQVTSTDLSVVRNVLPSFIKLLLSPSQ